MTDTFIVTITPPTPNGDLHIGHIAGPFLGADIFTRTQRLKGAQCYMVSYSDDYQSYLTRKAMESDTDAVNLAKVNSAKIQDSLRMADIQVDHWLESYENRHFEAATQMLYESTQAQGLIEAKTCFEPYCEHCDVWGYEAFARGGCDHCGHSSDPSQCEFCAMAPNVLEMSDLQCMLCHQPVVFKPVERRMLKLPMVAQALRERLDKAPMRPTLRAWVKEAYNNGLIDWGITRPGEAGLKLYDDEAHRVHTWFMGQAGYFAALKELSEHNEQARDAYELLFRDSTRLVNFLGMDCSYSHVLAYPAQVLLNPRFQFKNAFYTNAFLKLDGVDFSTSRGHAIWARDLVSDACADSVRFYVSLVAPEEHTENFEPAAFWTWRQHIFGVLLPKLASALSSGASVVGSEGVVLSELEGSLVEQWQQSARHDQFSMKGIALVLMQMLVAIEAQLDAGKVPRNLIALFALLGEPTLPSLNKALQQQLTQTERSVFAALLNLRPAGKESTGE
ncbi:methionine--tRNA ligase [Pseudomonas sp. RL_5y_Pfl2_73]|uniref:methionine--tRNA ligase n=1 Tax=Pseudomonas sp. RL_5y_Pfl2_73 TaxID=3088713 RepID=UPI0030D83FA4